MDCDSATYHTYFAAVVVFFILLVCSLPLVLSVLLWRHHEAVYAAAGRREGHNGADSTRKTARSHSIDQFDPDPEIVSSQHLRLMELAPGSDDLELLSVSPSSLLTPSDSSVNLQVQHSHSHRATVSGTGSSFGAPLSRSATLVSPLLLIYRPVAWYWPAVQLLRRVLFVTLNIALASQTPAQEFFSYVLLHFASLQLHLVVHPFASPLLNRCESVSLVTLTLLSLLLTAFPAPYSTGFQVVLFFAVVPLLSAFLALALAAACRSLTTTVSTSASPWLKPLRRRLASFASSLSFLTLVQGGSHGTATTAAGGDAPPREMNTRKHSADEEQTTATGYEPPRQRL